tara:strand:- start:30964 stop:34686 length:3723 start_codon:yes stop_codon:yes gene_type:complete
MAYNEVKIDVTYNVIQDGRVETVEGILDTYDINELPIALNYQVKNVENIGDSAGNYSKTIKVPATQNNNKVFHHLHSDALADIEGLTKNNALARIWTNGNLVFSGQLLVKAVIKDDKPSAYEISIVGDNNNWMFGFQNGNMCETEHFDLAPFDYDFGDPAVNWVKGQPILRSWTNSLWHYINNNIVDADSPADFVIPIIVKGQPEEAYTAPVGSPLDGAGAFKVNLSDQLPSPFIKSLIDSFFADEGYTVVSNFFETTEFKKLIMTLDENDFYRKFGSSGSGGEGQGWDAEYEFRYQNGFNHNPYIADETGTASLAFANYKYTNCYLISSIAEDRYAGTQYTVPFNVIIRDDAKACMYLAANDPKYPQPRTCNIANYWGKAAGYDNMGNSYTTYDITKTDHAINNLGVTQNPYDITGLTNISPKLGFQDDLPVKTGFQTTEPREPTQHGVFYPSDDDWLGANFYTGSSPAPNGSASYFGTSDAACNNGNVFEWRCKKSGSYNITGRIALAVGQNTTVKVRLRKIIANAQINGSTQPTNTGYNDVCPCYDEYVKGGFANQGFGYTVYPDYVQVSGNSMNLLYEEVTCVGGTVDQQVSWNTYKDPRFDGLFYKEVDIDLPLESFDFGDRVYCEITAQPVNISNVQIDAGIAYVLTQDCQMWDCFNPCYIAEKVVGNKEASLRYNGTYGMPEAGDGTGIWQSRRTYIKWELSTAIGIGDFFTVGEVLPCVPKSDFISGLTGLFNLHWYTDEPSKTVYVEPFSSFYNSPLNSEALDWTFKVDYHNEHRVAFLVDRLSRFINYKYADDGKDGHVGEVSDMQFKHWHSIKLDFGTAFLPEEKEVGTEFFGPTFMFNYGQVTTSSGEGPYVPLLISDFTQDPGNSVLPEISNGFLPRILSYEGLQQSDDVFWCSYRHNMNANNTTPAPIGSNNYDGEATEYPCAVSFIKNATFTNLDYDDNEDSGQAGLYSRFWKHYIDMLATNPRIKTIKVRLEPHDIAQLDLRVPVYIAESGNANGQYWIIHKIIDYAPHKDSLTDVELIQLAHPTEFVKSIDPPRGSGGIDDPPTVHGRLQNPNHWLSMPTVDRRFSEGTPIATRVSRPTAGTNRHTLQAKTSKNKFGSQRKKNKEVQLVNGKNDKSIRKAPSFSNNNRNLVFQNNGQIALGNNLVSYKNSQIVFGQFNKRDDDAILVIGGGTDEHNRKNILTIKEDGSMQFGDGGMNMVTTDSAGNVVDLYTKDGDNTTKVIK